MENDREQERGKSVMGKKYLFMTGIAVSAALWCRQRNKKYPLAAGYPLLNKFIIPESFLSCHIMRIANRQLAAMKQPSPPRGIKRMRKRIDSGKGEKIRLTVYRPVSVKNMLPCLVYFHGGGFCLEDAPYIHEHMGKYAEKAECTVVFVHYRTSEQHPFPIPFTDCWEGLEYVRQNSEDLHIDRERIAVGGDSAGGALAAACTLRSREEGKSDICFQMLIYPVLDARMKTESMKKYTDSPVWNARLSKKMWELYLKNGTFGKRYYASPAETEDFHNLPPAYIEVEQYDSLHDEGVNYWRNLKRAGIAAELQDVKGTFHGFDVFTKTDITKKMLDIRCSALRRAFNEVLQQSACRSKGLRDTADQ